MSRSVQLIIVNALTIVLVNIVKDVYLFSSPPYVIEYSFNFILGVYKRSVAWIRSYHDALHHIRRSMIKYDSKSMQQIRDDPRLAYYDPQNGIYF